MKNITELYFLVDELVKKITQQIKTSRGRKNTLTKSELITIALFGHFDAIPTDKKLHEFVTTYLQAEFNKVPCYEQFTRGMRSITSFLDLILDILTQLNKTEDDGLYIIDSTALPVSKFDDYTCPKWASDEATKGKNIFGYFYGFKLHLVINRSLEVVACSITKANVHDVKALSFQGFLDGIKGILIGDKGYVTQQAIIDLLKKGGIDLIFKQRKNMDPYLNEFYRYYLEQRQVIEGVFSYLKNRLGALRKFAHSCESFLLHVKTALIAFMIKDIDRIILSLGF